MIALQKPPPTAVLVKGVKKMIERDLAYGGGFTAKRAVLYITMGNNKIKLLHVKSPKKGNVNPQNMMWSFNFNLETGRFENKQRYYGEDQE